MDPVSQGVFGAVFAQTRSQKKNLAKAAVVGALAGMAPDLDIALRSTNDPLFALEFHRHFTHALIFIPVGALICSLVFYRFFRKRLRFAEIYLFALFGYGSHGLLDACTTYGTMLLWPFSDMRVAWNDHCTRSGGGLIRRGPHILKTIHWQCRDLYTFCLLTRHVDLYSTQLVSAPFTMHSISTFPQKSLP